jgi:hypothetical protein
MVFVFSLCLAGAGLLLAARRVRERKMLVLSATALGVLLLACGVLVTALQLR